MSPKNRRSAASLCRKCGKRLAKRSCPALGSAICQLCCGQLRGKEVHCPPACPHLAAHKHYQEKRVIERKPDGRRAAGQDILRDERLAWLAYRIEAALFEQAGRQPDFADKDAVLALEYAREKIKKGAGRLIIPGAALKPANQAGEAVLQAVERSRYQASVVLESGLEDYKREEKLACLERVSSGIKLALEADPSGRAYLKDLAARFAKAATGDRAKKLITLT